MTPWIRNAVDLVLERRKLAGRDVVTAVFGPDLNNPPTAGGSWVPGTGEPTWLCASRGHLFTGTDPAWCTSCGSEEDT